MKFPSVEIEKRDRDEHTDTLIKSLLNEEKSSKKQKRDPREDVGATQAVVARKGKTFAEIEAEEGGPIKESLVGMAHTKRAQNRKKRDVEADVGDTDVVANTERFEKEGLDVEQEDGITFEPFNLKQEREEGYFDEDGNYVLRKKAGEEGEDEGDAWLGSDEAKVVSDSVREKIEQQRAKAEEAARRGPLTERQIAQFKADMAEVMQPGETVTRALKRLGAASGAAAGAGGGALPHRAMGKRERARLLAQQQQQQQKQQGGVGSAEGAEDAEAARAAFTRLTELADELLEEGELEIYDATKEDLTRSARMWLPQLAGAAAAAPVAPAAAAQPPGSAGKAATAAAAADDDDDMFADDDGEEGKKSAQGSGAAAAADADQDMFSDDGDAEAKAPAVGAGAPALPLQPPPAASAPGAALAGAAAEEVQRPADGASDGAGSGPASASEAEAVDYGSWPIKELKRLLQERGVDPSGFVEKGDLVARVKEVLAAAGTAGDGSGAGAGGGAAEGAFVAPPGYVFDPASGYFFSEESGMYYDTATGGYCQAATGKWFYLDPVSGRFVEWNQG